MKTTDKIKKSSQEHFISFQYTKTSVRINSNLICCHLEIEMLLLEELYIKITPNMPYKWRLYSLEFLEPFKASSNILGPCLEGLEVCDPVALPGGVQGPDSERCTYVPGHFIQKSLHCGHLSLVDHKPPSIVEGVAIPVHHHTLHRRQESRGRSAGSHL